LSNLRANWAKDLQNHEKNGINTDALCEEAVKQSVLTVEPLQQGMGQGICWIRLAAARAIAGLHRRS
jgi:hypothetical protein